MMERWRSASCATNESTNNSNGGFYKNKHILYIKYKTLDSLKGYEVYLTDFDGHLWSERLEGSALHNRLKSEASGLEIKTVDLLKLLEQMCQNFVESSCESSSDLKDLILRASVKIGFIKLKWTFKTEACPFSEYNEMIRKDFLLPFFADLRGDKVIGNEIEDKDLTAFYEKIAPNLKQSDLPEKIIPISFIESPPSTDLNSFDSNETQMIESSPAKAKEPEPETVVSVEEIKRKELEEQLQASKKKKKKLI